MTVKYGKWLADHYDKAHPHYQQRWYQDKFDADVTLLLTYLGQTKPLNQLRILEFPTGTGYFTRKLAALTGFESLDTVDVSSHMLQHAQGTLGSGIAIYNSDIMKFLAVPARWGFYDLVVVSQFFTIADLDSTAVLWALDKAMAPRSAMYIVQESLKDANMPKRIYWPYAALRTWDTLNASPLVKEYDRRVSPGVVPLCPQELTHPLRHVGFNSEVNRFCLRWNETCSRLGNVIGATNVFSVVSWR